MKDLLSVGHPLVSRPRTLMDKITGTSRMERPSYGPKGQWQFSDTKKKRTGKDMLKSALQKLSGTTTFTNPNAGKFPKLNVKKPSYAPTKPKPFKPVGPTSNGIGVGY